MVVGDSNYLYQNAFLHNTTLIRSLFVLPASGGTPRMTLSQPDPVLGAMTPGPDDTWVAQVDDAEFVISGDRSGPFPAQREEAARVARQLSSVAAMLRAYLVRTTACPEPDWPRTIPLEFRTHVAIPNADSRWSLQWLAFEPGIAGSYRAFFVFDDEAQKMIYVLWIVDVQDDVPRSVTWKHW